MADRYGPVPADVHALLKYSAIKTAAEKIGIEAINRQSSILNVKFHDQTRVDAQKLMELVSGTRGAQFTPMGVLRLPVDGASSPAAMLDFIETALIAPLVE